MGGEKFWKGAERSAVIVGALATLVAAFYAAASYYGWTAAAEAPVKAVGHQPVTPSLPIWPAMVLAAVSVPLLLTGWVMIAERRRRERPRGPTTSEVERELTAQVAQLQDELRIARLQVYTKPAETGLSVSFEWKAGNFSDVQVYNALVSADKREKDIVLAARYATIRHTLGGAEWEWSPSKRLIERKDVIPGEHLTAEIFRRDVLSVTNGQDRLHILEDEVDLTNMFDIAVGYIFMLEITAASGDDVSNKRTIITLQRNGSRQIAHVLDKESLAYIRDSGRQM